MSDDKPIKTAASTGEANRSTGKRKKAKKAASAAEAPTEKKTHAEPEAAPERSSVVPTGTTAATKFSAIMGLVAAMVLALLANVVAGRHYHRWDFTKSGLYTLSRATVETLHALGEPIRIDVLVPASDPLSL